MIRLSSAMLAGCISGIVYGLLFVRHLTLRGSPLNVTPSSCTLLFNTLVRVALFIGVCVVMLRYWPDHFILGMVAFLGCLWLVIIVNTGKRRCKD